MKLLAGDVGGTKTTLALYDLDEGALRPVAEATFKSRDFRGLEEIAASFLEEAGSPTVPSACFGVAGPVAKARAHITNLPWVMDEVALAEGLGIERVRLVNDLVAIATAVPTLEAGSLRQLVHGKPEPSGVIAVLAPGTGLGEAFLVDSGQGYQAYPSEGGHTDFGPTDEIQERLLTFLRARYGHVSYERICCGIGIPNIYDFLLSEGRHREPDWLAQKLVGAGDRTPIIVEAALRDDEPIELCRATLELMVSVLGAEAGNLALKVYAKGGVFIAGGIPPRILPFLETEAFQAAFLGKGRLRTALEGIPVWAVLEPQAALIGAANIARKASVGAGRRGREQSTR